MLNLKKKIGNQGAPLTPQPFSLCNAGLYDFDSLRSLPWDDWRFFALQLFECEDAPHTLNGVALDGTRRGASVLLFNHQKNPTLRIDEDFVRSLHDAIGDKIGDTFYIVAPKGIFDYQQDYLDFDGVRYYALRIPYSFISELHRTRFTTLKQPSDETAVNDIVDAYGFDFIERPTLEYQAGAGSREGSLLTEAFVKITAFESRARIKGGQRLGGLETLSLLMLDYDYKNGVFDFDKVIYGHEIAAQNGTAYFPLETLGENVMAVFVDIHGNEAQEVIARTRFVPAASQE